MGYIRAELAVECPTCGAPKFTRCRSLSGLLHDARERAVRQAVIAAPEPVER